MLNVKQLLAETAKIFTTNPEKFTKTTLARNANGTPVSVLNPDAVCFCAIGMVLKLAAEQDVTTRIRLESDIDTFRIFREITGLGSTTVYNFNDDYNGRENIIQYFKDKANEIA